MGGHICSLIPLHPLNDNLLEVSSITVDEQVIYMHSKKQLGVHKDLPGPLHPPDFDTIHDLVRQQMMDTVQTTQKL